MVEVLNFTVNKNNGSYKTEKYRITKDYKNSNMVYYLQYETTINGFTTYVNESDDTWISLGHLLVSDKFQNLFK